MTSTANSSIGQNTVGKNTEGKPELIIFMGLQASGKSSFYTQHFLQTHLRISNDLLRTRHREQVILKACLSTEMSVVIDNTNPTKTDRQRYLQAIADMPQYRKTGYFFQSRIHDCIARNEKRSGKANIPRQGLLHTHAILEMPAYNEGFDELYFVALDEEHGGFNVSPWKSDQES